MTDQKGHFHPHAVRKIENGGVATSTMNFGYFRRRRFGMNSDRFSRTLPQYAMREMYMGKLRPE